jgi:transcriptional regulator with PAS, ATPase and Fis domain
MSITPNLLAPPSQHKIHPIQLGIDPVANGRQIRPGTAWPPLSIATVLRRQSGWFWKLKTKSMEDHANLSRATLLGSAPSDGLIGESVQMHALHELITKVSHTKSPILLQGETGTGKELVARSIHFSGPRREKMFVPVDCSALTPTLVESELFGHVRGAFTGADHSKKGLLQTANDGTIFLDEIGELPMFLQAKLLRALQEKEIRPVGCTELVPIDARVVAATNRDLQAGVRAGTFRQDLFYRLNVVQIRLPPLRERKIDIPLLVDHFLRKFSSSEFAVKAISDYALQRLLAYDWPGNVRELENAIERAVALSTNNVLSADDLESVPDAAPLTTADSNELVPLAEMERRAIVHALRQTGQDKLAAARLLGIGKTTLYRKLKEYARSSNESGRDVQEEP